MKPAAASASRRWTVASGTTPGHGSSAPDRPRVLVVDDDPDILQALSELLENMLGMPVQVDTASSADAAKARLENGERFDLVLTDERLPGTRGSELLAWILERKLPCRRVLMSAFYEGTAAHHLAQGAGAEAFLHKPLRLDILLPQVRQMLGA